MASKTSNDSSDPKFDPNIDYYSLIGKSLHIDSTSSEIRKAYRKRAIEVHPDKNPDNPHAADIFHELQLAYEILSNANTRAQYNQSILHKLQLKQQRLNEDKKIRDLKDKLEAQELQARQKKTTGTTTTTATGKSSKPIFSNFPTEEEEQIAKQQSLNFINQIRAHQKRKQETVPDTNVLNTNRTDTSNSPKSDLTTVVIHWKHLNKSEISLFSTDFKLQNQFSEYGTILNISIDKSKQRTCITFNDAEAAERLMAGLAVEYSHVKVKLIADTERQTENDKAKNKSSKTQFRDENAIDLDSIDDDDDNGSEVIDLTANQSIHSKQVHNLKKEHKKIYTVDDDVEMQIDHAPVVTVDDESDLDSVSSTNRERSAVQFHDSIPFEEFEQTVLQKMKSLIEKQTK